MLFLPWLVQLSFTSNGLINWNLRNCPYCAGLELYHILVYEYHNCNTSIYVKVVHEISNRFIDRSQECYIIIVNNFF